MKSIILDVHDAITRAERIAASLSGVGSSSSEKLKPFTDLVVELSRKVEQRGKAGISSEETRGMARRLKNILVAVNDYDKARDIARILKLKDAL